LSTETHIPVDIRDKFAQKRYRNKINESRKDLLNKIEQDDLKEGRKNLKPDDLKEGGENLEPDDLKEGGENLKPDDLKEGGENLEPDDLKEGGENLKPDKDNSQQVQENIKQDSLKRIQKWLTINALKFQFLVADVFRSIVSLEIFQIFPLFSFLQLEPDERVAVAVSPDEEESSGSLRYLERPSVEIYNQEGKINAALRNKIDLEIYNQEGTLNLTTGKTNDIKQTEDLPSQTSLEIPKEFSITLYPGDSLVKHFVLKTRKWLFFNPVSHTFQIQVRYRIDETDHIDTIPFSVDIRAPMRSSIFGAIIGSILGLIVSEDEKFGDFQDILSKDFLLKMSRTVIFALIIIVAFARKSNVQQVVSVEDFWGGLFTGFLVGYSGDPFIQSILGKGNGESEVSQ